jgi:hypothetical protein
VRLVQNWPVQIGPFKVPGQASIVAVPLSAGLVLWGLSSLRPHTDSGR